MSVLSSSLRDSDSLMDAAVERVPAHDPFFLRAALDQHAGSRYRHSMIRVSETSTDCAPGGLRVTRKMGPSADSPVVLLGTWLQGCLAPGAFPLRCAGPWFKQPTIRGGMQIDSGAHAVLRGFTIVGTVVVSAGATLCLAGCRVAGRIRCAAGGKVYLAHCHLTDGRYGGDEGDDDDRSSSSSSKKDGFLVSTEGTLVVHGCVLDGPADGCGLIGRGNDCLIVARDMTVQDCGSTGLIAAAGARVRATDCDFIGCGGNGVELVGLKQPVISSGRLPEATRKNIQVLCSYRPNILVRCHVAHNLAAGVHVRDGARLTAIKCVVRRNVRCAMLVRGQFSELDLFYSTLEDTSHGPGLHVANKVPPLCLPSNVCSQLTLTSVLQTRLTPWRSTLSSRAAQRPTF
jgi:hypothetical protein